MSTTDGPRGSRRQPLNANHLLNFRSSAPSSQINGTRGTRGGRGGPVTRRQPPRPARYDRTKFLQANFRFLISDTIDLRHYDNADTMVDWEDVAMVVHLTTQKTVCCPITLSPVFCPYITPCGHIYSGDAIIAHMVSVGGPQLRSSSLCPVCATPIVARELRPVVIRPAQVAKPGEKITLQLLRRQRTTIIPEVVLPSTDTRRYDKNNREAPSLSSWAKLPSAITTTSPKLRQGKERDEILECNPYAKFTLVDDPIALWQHDAQTLGRKAAGLLAEGGPEAEYEIPPLFTAIEALANRAKAWTERRYRLLWEAIEGPPAEAPSSLLSPEEAGARAAKAVKIAAEEASSAAARDKEKERASKVLEVEFPSLSIGKIGKRESSHQEELPALVGNDDKPFLTLDNVLSAPTRSILPSTKIIDPSAAASLYYYQAQDGQWLFLHPINLKMLVEHYGSYTALPAVLTAPVLEIEELVQTEAMRKRNPALGHLPLLGVFKFCEMDLSEILPSESIAPFIEELQLREKKRAKQVKIEQRREKREAAVEAAAAAATAGPSAAELAAMPLPGKATEPVPVPGVQRTEGESVDEAFEEALSPSGPSFARIAAMGFAATGPSLNESSPPMQSSPSPVATGAWGAWGRGRGISEQPVGNDVPPPGLPTGKGGKKGKKILLMTTNQRRY